MAMKPGIAFITAAVLSASALTAVAQPQDQDRDRVHREQQVDRDRDLDRDRDRDVDRDRLGDRDRLDQSSQDRDRVQDRTHGPDFAKLNDGEIYGSEVMTRRERDEYRSRLQNAESAEAREQLRAEHQAQMQIRAQEKGLQLKPTSEGPIYGGALLTTQERNQYRERMSEIGSDAEREQFLAQHREQMQARAREQGVPFADLDQS